jgi:hypothetical protein
MSTSASNDEGTRPLDSPPTFDLESAYDDPDDPERVTISPENPEHPTTEWLTIDAGFAVPIEETV